MESRLLESHGSRNGQNETDSDEGNSNKNSSSEESLNLKLKEIPLVHQSRRKPNRYSNHPSEIDNFCSPETNCGEECLKWTVGGPKNAVLQFRCCALSNPPVDPPANELHMTYKTVQAETKLLAAILNAHGMREVHNSIPDFNLLWTGVHPKPHVLKDLTAYQRVNHFPRSFELTRKDRLCKNVEKMQMLKGAKHFDFIPQTFVMPAEYRELCSSHHRNKGPWIVKPVASSRGRGIYIVNSPEQVPLEETVVVAKYIDNPLLVDGHKCDLRLYVVVTSYDPLLVYLYEEGLVRFATVKYDSGGKHLWNPCMHLCNYSINKYHSDYVKSDDPEAEDVGHKWTLSALLRHLRAAGTDTALLMSRIEEVIVKSILASAPPIVAACRMFVPHTHNCFELYGFDILVDSELKPWLLEVNLSPSLGCDSPLDVRVKSAMLVDLLTLVGLPAIDPMLRRINEPHHHSNPADSTKKLNCRRVHSADTLTVTAAATGSRRANSSSARLTYSSLSLSPEESRIVRCARMEYERRGGFVRIFPSVESWNRYSAFLDPVTGITCHSGTTSMGHPCSTTGLIQHNYNLTLHQQLFPGEIKKVQQQPRSVPKLPERLARYERALAQGHCTVLEEKNQSSQKTEEGTNKPNPNRYDVNSLRQEILHCFEKGNRLSQNQARRIFCQYLQCILRRLANKEGFDTDDDNNSELILRFLQRASSNLRTPYFVQPPNRKLSGKDRVAVVAKQLSDFIYLYSRETELYTEATDRPHCISSELCTRFLIFASESDLEEVLSAHSRVFKCVHTYLGRCGPAPTTRHPLGLLRSYPHAPGGTSCETRRASLSKQPAAKRASTTKVSRAL
ncbi:tubulin polyglutamylase TTLL5 isoform X1 [Schistocerca cancellata]|uniref:tubulin polyglutamylase TTLL5 isoform X1 n=1 Tax=Schistocerca cancellata TaxID=274614 RepID=UPI0021178E82|nr:tubulin polyglutamylase TTLL5 isoform X1 [Schistocerca cancellata]